MELNAAIGHQKSDKTPGPDGIPTEFFHRFTHDISVNLKKTRYFNF